MIGDFCLYYVSRIMLIIIDFCYKDNTGEESYKGAYSYNNSLASSNATTQNCRYNQGVNYRRCIPDLQNGPHWSNADLRECQPKEETTRKLISLSLSLVSSGLLTSANFC